MKKFISCVMLAALSLMLAACGGKEQSVSYTIEEELDGGVIMTDSITLDAKGDKVQRITEDMELQMDSATEERQADLMELYDAFAEQYQSVEGVECTVEKGDGSYSMNIVIDASEKVISEVKSQNILEIVGDSTKLSLEKSQAELQANGYTLVEQEQQ